MGEEEISGNTDTHWEGTSRGNSSAIPFGPNSSAGSSRDSVGNIRCLQNGVYQTGNIEIFQDV